MNQVKAIHRIRQKQVASVILVLFVSFQILPQSRAEVPMSPETQGQVSSRPIESVVPAENQKPSSQTSIDFLVENESPLKSAMPVMTPGFMSPDIKPVPDSKPVVPLKTQTEKVVDEPKINPFLILPPAPATGEFIEMKRPEVGQELIPVGQPLELKTPFQGSAVVSLTVIKKKADESKHLNSESFARPQDLFRRIFKAILGKFKELVLAYWKLMVGTRKPDSQVRVVEPEEWGKRAPISVVLSKNRQTVSNLKTKDGAK